MRVISTIFCSVLFSVRGCLYCNKQSEFLLNCHCTVVCLNENEMVHNKVTPITALESLYVLRKLLEFEFDVSKV